MSHQQMMFDDEDIFFPFPFSLSDESNSNRVPIIFSTEPFSSQTDGYDCQYFIC